MTENDGTALTRDAQISILPAQSSDYADIVSHQLAAGMVGCKQLWPRSSFVLPSESGFFKPETHLYQETLRKDLQNGKELEYVHSAGCWIEQGLAAMSLFRDESSAEKQSKFLWLIEEDLEASK